MTLCLNDATLRESLVLLFYQRRGLMMIKLTLIRYFIFQIIVSSMKKRKTNHKGGGLGINAHKTLDYKILPNVAKNTENIETFIIELENKNSKNILISAVYQPPHGNQSKFL